MSETTDKPSRSELGWERLAAAVDKLEASVAKSKADGDGRANDAVVAELAAARSEHDTLVATHDALVATTETVSRRLDATISRLKSVLED